MGSSPHARGTHWPPYALSTSTGIIPACAGNTFFIHAHRGSYRDHPRMRGEHWRRRRPSPSTWGSSPHARGTRECGVQLAHGPGIIPACAGNTKKVNAVALSTGDHPRMRGEHTFLLLPVVTSPGSSPHARGTLQQFHAHHRYGGIIPACAGNTGSDSATACEWWDHPRMRGEHAHNAGVKINPWGSSPHARGTLPGRLCHKRMRGIIPACAGNTRRC